MSGRALAQRVLIRGSTPSPSNQNKVPPKPAQWCSHSAHMLTDGLIFAPLFILHHKEYEPDTPHPLTGRREKTHTHLGKKLFVCPLEEAHIDH